MKTKRITQIFLCLALLIVMGGEMLLSAFSITASAVFTKETDVLEDLKVDSSFNEADYPLIEGDYSLKLIQLAESESGDIFLYVYKPSGNTTDIVATEVNMSDTGTAVGLAMRDLTLVDSSGVFQKYRVDGIKRSNEFVRKYFIVSLFRPWNEDYGDKTSEDSIGVAKAYPVETIWTATTDLSGKVTYSAEYSDDVITVTSSCAGYIYYDEGFIFQTAGIESHYFAFSTNKPIDTIYQAYVEYDYHYTYRDYSGLIPVETDETGTRNVTLNRSDVFEVPDGTIFHGEYQYKRIQSVGAFLKNEGTVLTEEATKSIGTQQWILRYVETSYYYNPTSYPQFDTDITAIKLFRLRYEYNHNIYDVGVVADIITEDDIADGYVEEQEWWQKIVLILSIILILCFWNTISPIVTTLFKVICTGIKFIFEMLWAIITLPIQLIQQAFSKDKPHRKRKRR